MKAFLTVVLLFLLLVTAILVGAQNDQLVTVNYLVAQSTLKLSVLMALMLLAGVILSFAVFSLFWLRLKLKIGQLERKQKRATDSHSA